MTDNKLLLPGKLLNPNQILENDSRLDYRLKKLIIEQNLGEQNNNEIKISPSSSLKEKYEHIAEQEPDVEKMMANLFEDVELLENIDEDKISIIGEDKNEIDIYISKPKNYNSSLPCILHIHGGGMDLKFPHHECEIAQANVCFGTNAANYWVHANMLTLNGAKMSKSSGNNILPDEIFYSGSALLSKTFSEPVVKFFMLQAHYRSVLDISNDALIASEKGFSKILDAINVLELFEKFNDQTDFNIEKWREKCYEAMNDDFNTPILIANLFDAVKFINQLNNGKARISKSDCKNLLQILNSFVFEILGLEKNIKSKKVNDKTNDVIEILIKLRDEARLNKNYELSDKIRDMLNNKGIVINDSETNSSFSIN